MLSVGLVISLHGYRHRSLTLHTYNSPRVDLNAWHLTLQKAHSPIFTPQVDVLSICRKSLQTIRKLAYRIYRLSKGPFYRCWK